MNDNRWIHFIDERSDLSKSFSGKTSPYIAVVLGVSSMKTFQEVARPDETISWNGQDAALIKLGPGGWDILAIEYEK